MLTRKDLVELLNLSYDKNLSDYKTTSGKLLTVDRNMSGQRLQVYSHENKRYIVHRGSSGFMDWLGNIRSVFGDHIQKRFAHARKITQQVESQVGSENVVHLGHSKGGLIARTVAGNESKIITLNAAPDIGSVIVPRARRRGVTQFRNKNDAVSALDQTTTADQNDTVEVDTDTSALKVLENHAPDSILTNTEEDDEVIHGSGQTINRWIGHVRKIRAECNCSYMEALVKAKESYHPIKGGSAKSGYVQKLIGSHDVAFNVTKISNPSKSAVEIGRRQNVINNTAAEHTRLSQIKNDLLLYKNAKQQIQDKHALEINRIQKLRVSRVKKDAQIDKAAQESNAQDRELDAKYPNVAVYMGSLRTKSFDVAHRKLRLELNRLTNEMLGRFT